MNRNRKLYGSALFLALGLATVAGTASAQSVGYNVRTGDVWVDARLGEINDYGMHHRAPFIDEMTGHYGAPRPLVIDLLERRRWAPADVYYACAIAHALRRPCGDVVREYDRDPGQGWGAVAKRMGIKPGSDAFHALKRGTAGTYDRWGHPIVVDRAVRVDLSAPGRGKGNGSGNGNGVDKAKGSSGNKPQSGNSQRGNNGNNGNRGQGKGKDKDKP